MCFAETGCDRAVLRGIIEHQHPVVINATRRRRELACGGTRKLPAHRRAPIARIETLSRGVGSVDFRHIDRQRVAARGIHEQKLPIRCASGLAAAPRSALLRRSLPAEASRTRPPPPEIPAAIETFCERRATRTVRERDPSPSARRRDRRRPSSRVRDGDRRRLSAWCLPRVLTPDRCEKIVRERERATSETDDRETGPFGCLPGFRSETEPLVDLCF